jgi:hypothetical protein
MWFFCSPTTPRTLSLAPSIPISAFCVSFEYGKLSRRYARNKLESAREAVLGSPLQPSILAFLASSWPEKDRWTIAECLARKRFDLMREPCESLPLSLLLWCLSVPEALKTDPSPVKSDQEAPMKAIPAEVIAVETQGRPIPRSRSMVPSERTARSHPTTGKNKQQKKDWRS